MCLEIHELDPASFLLYEDQHVKHTDKSMKDYDNNKESSYQYWDVNNSFG